MSVADSNNYLRNRVMQASLRSEVNAALCEQMSSLCDFVYRKLVSGSVTRESVETDDAVKILRHQRQTWVMLKEKVTEARAESEHGDPRDTEVLEPGSLSVEG